MSPRKQQVHTLFDEGLEVIDRLGLALSPDRFFPMIQCRTGVTEGARGGMKNGVPGIYIGTRGHQFDKATALRRYKEFSDEAVWKRAREHARRGEWLYVEYTHIHDDPEIGGFISDDPIDHIRALVAHELAHAVHHWNRRNGGELDKIAHGPAWQKIYRELRVEWVNKNLTP